MNPDDDPEARIRALEQPLSQQAAASELGTAQPGGDAYAPPPAPAYSPPGYSTPAYGSPPPSGVQDYGSAQPYTQPYGAQPFDQSYGQLPRQKSSGGIPWVVFGVIAVLFIGGLAAGAVVYTMSSGSSGSGGGGSINVPTMPSIEIPSMPSLPSMPSVPAAPGAPSPGPEGLVAAPGQDVTVSGIDENKTVTCNEGSVNVSGIRNTVNITGHCSKITVSGINNVITVDAADTIGASGFDNQVTYHSGSPQIDASGSNTVSQG
ncbi:DUF3060 domain-containing protein [Mycolicibacterium moriokaense]|nr:DUF3060 domain-containing protein [Mycolicibacterium moriokaense]